MKVVITGASGFIGRNLLLKTPKAWKIFALYNTDVSFLKFVEENSLRNVMPVKCNLSCHNEVEDIVSQIGIDIDLCIYLASIVRLRETADDPIVDIDISVKGLLNFLEKFSIGRMIYMSSGAVYEGLNGPVSPNSMVSPTLPYAISKLISEMFVKYYQHRRHKISDFIILRFFGAFGPYEPSFKIFTKLVKTFGIEHNREFTIIGDGENLIDAMFIEDAVQGIIEVSNSSNLKNKIIDFASHNPITINELVKRAADFFGIKNPQISHLGNVPEYITFYSIDYTLERELGFKPVIKLEEGLKRLYDFLKGRKK